MIAASRPRGLAGPAQRKAAGREIQASRCHTFDSRHSVFDLGNAARAVRATDHQVDRLGALVAAHKCHLVGMPGEAVKAGGL